jgi:hypothetical protein
MGEAHGDTVYHVRGGGLDPVHPISATNSIGIESRGDRIELVRSRSRSAPSMASLKCAVLALPTNGFEGTTICCAWTPRLDAGVDPPKLRAALADASPSYMLSSKWLQSVELPRKVGGRVHRRLLDAGFAGQPRND